MQLRNKFRHIMAGAAGGSAFVLMLLATSLGLPINAAAGVTLYLALLLLIKKKKEPHEIEVAPDVSLKKLTLVRRLGEAVARRLSELAAEAPDPKSKEQIRSIRETIQEIFDNFEDDPADINRSMFFIEEHMDSSMGMISDFVRLSKRTLDEKGKEQLVEYRKSLEQIQELFSDHLQKCLADDLTRARVDNKMMDLHAGELERPDL